MGSEGGAGAASGRRSVVSREIRLGKAIPRKFREWLPPALPRFSSPAVHSSVGGALLVISVTHCDVLLWLTSAPARDVGLCEVQQWDVVFAS